MPGAYFVAAKVSTLDKTFAPDHRTAKEMFSLAGKYGVKCFFASALRYAQEPTDDAEDALRVPTTWVVQIWRNTHSPD